MPRLLIFAQTRRHIDKIEPSTLPNILIDLYIQIKYISCNAYTFKVIFQQKCNYLYMQDLK